MVVLAPGAVIRPEDIPSEIRSGGSDVLLPGTEVSVPSFQPPGSDVDGIPQLEFVFRTLIALKVDVEDLKREFEAYKSRRLLTGRDRVREGVTIEVSERTSLSDASESVEWEGDPTTESPSGSLDLSTADTSSGQEDIAFRSGMTMADLECAAIIATLRSVGGNRRKAAEQLQIGERTLYRKIKQYEMDR